MSRSRVVILQPSDLDPADFVIDPTAGNLIRLRNGSGGGGVTPLLFIINNVASFAANHGRTYRPAMVLVDEDGNECVTDVAHNAGQAVLTFAMPFTGQLTVF